MSFKVGDFYTCTNTPMIINYVKSPANINGEYGVISVTSGTEFHTTVCNNCILHPTLGIEPADQMLHKKTSIIYTGIRKSLVSTFPFELQNMNTVKYEYTEIKELILNTSNLTNSHWNTCAQHYRTHVLSTHGQQVQASQQISNPFQPKFSVGDKILDTRAGQFVINGTVSKVDTTRNEYTIAWLGGASTVQDFTSAEKDFVLDLLTGQIISNGTGSVSWNVPVTTTGSYQIYRGSTTPQLDKAIETIQKEFGSNCNHKFIEYDSGWTKYTFCEKCNYKKD